MFLDFHFILLCHFLLAGHSTHLAQHWALYYESECWTCRRQYCLWTTFHCNTFLYCVWSKGVPQTALRYSVYQRHLPFFTQQNFYFSAGSWQNPFQPISAVATFLISSLGSAWADWPQSGRNPKVSSSRLAVSLACGSWESHLACYSRPMHYQCVAVVAMLSYSGVRPGTRAAAIWGKRMVQLVWGHTSCECSMLPLGTAQPQSTPGFPCLLQAQWMLLRPNMVYPQGTNHYTSQTKSLFYHSSKEELCISFSEGALALSSGLPYSTHPMSHCQALQHRNDAVCLRSSLKIFNNMHPPSAS